MTGQADTPKPGDMRPKWTANMASGTFWMISLRWALRLTGLVSTTILARLLVPRDFGIVAMAMIVVGTLEMFNQTGQKLVLIRLEDPTDDHYNSAWTISLLIGLFIAVVIIAVSPLAVTYFHEPRIVPVMQCLALRSVLGGLENIGTIRFRRDFRFAQFFLYNVCPKLVSFVVTIALAFMLRNYWALVVGMLTGQATLVLLSYVMHGHRPKINFSRVGEIWSFSIWTFVRSMGFYMNTQIDQIIVGGFGGSSLMGRYAVAVDVAQSPGREINEPMIAVTYPVMSRLQQHPEELRNVYLHTLGWTAFICASTGAGVALVAPGLQALILGSHWSGIAPLMEWLAIGGGIMGLSSGAYSLFDAVGLPHVGARLIWVRLIILAIMIAPVAFWTRDILDVAICRTVGEALFIPSLFKRLGATAGVSWKDYYKTLYRPLAGAIAMVAVVLLFNWSTALPPIYNLFLDVPLGASVFGITTWALWRRAGRPLGPEQDALHHLSRIFRPANGAVRAQPDYRA